MDKYYDHEDVRRLLKWATFVVIILGIFLLARTIDAFKALREPGANYSTIVVSGYGESFATADVAAFSFTVSADNKVFAEAQDTVTTKTNAIIAALKNLGIDEKDIQTTDYNIYPKYTYMTVGCAPNTICQPGRQVPDGYTASNTITVKVRKADDAGKALAAVAQNGGTGISGLNFTVDDLTSVQNEARDKAVQDAKAKAESLAKSLGVSLGRVVDFSDGLSNPSPRPLYEASAGNVASDKAIAPSISLGQNKVTDNVSITYEIH